MKNVLILQSEISSYNVSTFNYISQSYLLTVGYLTKDKSNIDCSFEKKKFQIINVGPFTFVKGLRDYCRNFDVICIMPNLRILSYSVLPFLNHHNKMISWSIGFRVSYTHPYLTDRKRNIMDFIFQLVLSNCDANIFYMKKSKEFWRKTSLRMDNVFEAINTTNVVKIDFAPESKRDFLFVGTLYKGKGLDLLLEAFKSVVTQCNCDIKLQIVGEGSERESLEAYVIEHGLQDRVVFHGSIYDENEISKVFQESLLCFSPKQAGLSVPKSMGYGVPFVTRKDAITGGEIYHITSGVNGIMYDIDDDLPKIMFDAIENRQKFIEMGRNAMEYYYNHATIKHMAQGAIDAIEYALNH